MDAEPTGENAHKVSRTEFYFIGFDWVLIINVSRSQENYWGTSVVKQTDDTAITFDSALVTRRLAP